MSKSKYTDAVCVVLLLVMLLTVFLFRRGEELGIEPIERENVLSGLSAKAVIGLSDQKITVKGEGAYEQDGVIHVAYGGEYTFTGSCSDCRIVVDTDGKSKVKLIFDGAELTSSAGPVVLVENAGRTTLTSAANSQNILRASDLYSEQDVSGANAAVYSRDDLVLSGKGSITVISSAHGISSRDELKIEGGEWIVRADRDGIRGKDSLTITGGAVDVTAAEDGLCSDNDVDEGKGSFRMDGGTLTVDVGQDGIQAAGDLTVTGGSLNVSTGGGAPAELRPKAEWIDRDEQTNNEETFSAKGLKCGGSLLISGGDLSLDCADDALHATVNGTLSGGTVTVRSGDDGFHADEAVTVSGGTFHAERCVEGIEAQQVTVSGGCTDITSVNDGINANGRSRGVAMSTLTVSGGTVKLWTQADGFDSNGDILITGGTILISAEPSDGNSAVDYGIENGGDCRITGGSIVACGYAGMAETFSENTAQPALLYIFEEAQPGGTLVTLTDEKGRELLSFAPENAYDCVIFSCGEMALGGKYTVSAGAYSETVVLNALSQRVGSTFGDRSDRPGLPPDGNGRPGEGGFPGMAPGDRPPTGGFGE